MDASDEQLVEQCVEGDTTAFAQLVARYQTLVCSVAYAITGDFARSEDIGQDSFIAAWKQLAELNDASRFKSWICSITRNLAHNAMRRDRRLQFDDFSETVADAAFSPSDQAARNEEQSLVWSALAQLPENYREPLVLFYRQDQSVAEVAKSLDVSADVAKQRLSRGRRMLREEMLSVVERTLQRTVPTQAFTVAVLAALSSLSSKTAAAATAGSTAVLAKAALGSGASKAGGVMGSALGGIAGFGGAALGTWASWTTAQYQSQRDLIRRSTFIYIVGCSLFAIPFVAMSLGWRPHRQLGSGGYLIAYGVWMTLFWVANIAWMFRTFRLWKQITRREQVAGTSELPMTPARRWLAKWEGRRWTSRQRLLGRPLIHIAFSDPIGDLFGEPRRVQGMARGWIAIGDNARGVVLAVGNLAVAPVAVGTISVGVVSIGVLSVGLFSLGVLSVAAVSAGIVSLGVYSFAGTVAVGFLAAGPVAIGWEAAYGAVAVAFEYAEGAKAIAAHAGDEAAKLYFANSAFFQWATDLLQRIVVNSRSPHWPWAILIVPVLFVGFWRAAYRRKPSR